MAHAWLPLVSLGLGVCILLAPRNARAQANAQDTKVRVGFSNLVARLDNDQIGFANAEYRVHMLEALRAAGFNAVGAESLVFDKDEGQRAALILGGTVRELECRHVARKTNCRVGIEWELLDREKDAVIYRTLARHMESGLDDRNPAQSGRKLALGALRSLIQRPRFSELLTRPRLPTPESTSYSNAGFRSCNAGERELPAHFNEAADATFLIKEAGGFGSGFNISPDGLVMTAAHVVSGPTVELTRRGDPTPITGTVVRLERKHDAALIALTLPAGASQPCLELQPTPPAAGDDVYAIGSPASQDLAFSLTRGIVSGLRLQQGVQLLQTDASLSPGNSGGPLLDRHGRAVGVVSRKIAGQAVEGLGFGVQIQDALQALKITSDSQTDEALLRPAAAVVSAPKTAPIVDAPTPTPSLDPAGDRRRFEEEDYERRVREQSAATPWYVAPLRYTGLVASLAGFVGIIYSTGAGNTEHITHSEFSQHRTQNDISWVMFGLGTSAFAVSFPLQPRLPPPRSASPTPSARLSVIVGPRQASVGLRLGL